MFLANYLFLNRRKLMEIETIPFIEKLTSNYHHHSPLLTTSIFTLLDTDPNTQTRLDLYNDAIIY
jgi:hypothetical protein